MKTVRLFTLLVSLLLPDYVPALTPPASLSGPAVSPHQLFYLQRSKDRNTVIYEANIAANQKLNPSKPVQVYWIRYAERGQREDLSKIQWQMAYGYTHKPSVPESDSYDITLNAFRKRSLRVIHHQGKPVAVMVINGQRAYLHNVFVQLDPKARLVPHVQYIEMYGVDLATDRPVYERIVP